MDAASLIVSRVSVEEGGDARAGASPHAGAAFSAGQARFVVDPAGDAREVVAGSSRSADSPPRRPSDQEAERVLREIVRAFAEFFREGPDAMPHVRVEDLAAAAEVRVTVIYAVARASQFRFRGEMIAAEYLIRPHRNRAWEICRQAEAIRLLAEQPDMSSGRLAARITQRGLPVADRTVRSWLAKWRRRGGDDWIAAAKADLAPARWMVGKLGEPWANVVDEITRRLVEQFCAQKVVLFGSRARGTAHRGSDYDFLVVADHAGPLADRMAGAHRCIEGLGVPVDVLVFTPEEIERFRQWPGHVVRAALTEGKVLHGAA